MTLSRLAPAIPSAGDVMAETVIHHILRRLNEIGVDDVFGVAGDYAFPVNDAIVEHPPIKWVGCCNELNAGYAADGYARMRGVHHLWGGRTGRDERCRGFIRRAPCGFSLGRFA